MSTNGALTDDQVDQLADGMRGDSERSAVAREMFLSRGPQIFPGAWELDLTVGECPDRPLVESDRLDATLVYARFESKHGLTRLREGTARWPTFMRKRFTDQHALRESLPRAMREAFDSFDFGGDQLGFGWGGSSEYIPLLPGPATRQLYWQDYFAMSAKAFEAVNHDPISWRCSQALEEFVLGKGVEMTVTKTGTGDSSGQRHDQGQKVWDEFWARNRMDDRIRVMTRDASTFGELFARYFPAPRVPDITWKALTIRSLDPASIYDLITDPEDMESVYAYHQQFQTAYQLYAPPRGAPASGTPPTGNSGGALSKFVIRQIPAPEIDHYRLNVSGSERRGRSDLYPALTWIQTIRHYLRSKVIRADMLSRIVWDLSVEGTLGDITALENQLLAGGRDGPQAGSIFGHGPTATLAPMIPGNEVQGSQVDPTFIAQAALICASFGVPLDYILQVMRGGTRANALVATEPAAKRFERRQSWVETVIHDMFDRVMASAGITDAELEATFPPIATEDTTQLLKNVSYMESNMYYSKKSAATQAAKAMGDSTYDFETEQKLIASEFPEPEMEDDPDAPDPVRDPITGLTPPRKQRPKQGDGVIRRTMISIDNRQTAKLDPTKSPSEEDQPPGLLVPYTGAAPVGPDGQPMPPSANAGQGASPPTRGGAPASENPASAAGANSIKAANGATREVLEAIAALGDQVRELREGRPPRRRPDDPEFKSAARAYNEQTAQHLKDLLATTQEPE